MGGSRRPLGEAKKIKARPGTTTTKPDQKSTSELFNSYPRARPVKLSLICTTTTTTTTTTRYNYYYYGAGSVQLQTNRIKNQNKKGDDPIKLSNTCIRQNIRWFLGSFLPSFSPSFPGQNPRISRASFQEFLPSQRHHFLVLLCSRYNGFREASLQKKFQDSGLIFPLKTPGNFF